MRRVLLLVLAGSAVMATGACQQALIYGERTSFNLASVNLNDDVSEPVKVKIGAYRSVAAVAPSRGGPASGEKITDPTDSTKQLTIGRGEAVSVFSKFDLDYLGNRSGFTQTNTVPLWNENLNIRTQFASGHAAIAIANNTTLATQMMGIGIDTSTVFAQRKAIVDCVKKKNAAANRQDFSNAASSLKIAGLAATSDAELVKEMVLREIGTASVAIEQIIKLPIAKDCAEGS